MLKQFRLGNFKALKDLDIELGRITVLIGPNGTGKSTVLQALTLLKQSLLQASLITSGPALDLGVFQDVVHRGDATLHIQFQLQVAALGPGLSPFPEGLFDQVYEAEFDQHGLRRHTETIPFGDDTIKVRWDRHDGSFVEPSTLPMSNQRSVHWQVMNLVAHPIDIRGMGGQFTDNERNAFPSYLYAVEHFLRGTYVVPPVRGFDATSYPLESAPSDDLFATRSVEQQASRVLSTIAYRPELEAAISDFSERVLHVRLRAKLVPSQRVAAEAYRGQSRMNLVNEGFGANQLMILLAQLVLAPRGALLGIEEVEIHLHPRAQSALAPIFTELVRGQDKQVVLTTHSEHVLMGLLTLVATAALNPDDLRVYYFQKDDSGAVNVELLKVDEQGRLKGGMKGFFEANVNELDTYLEAVSQRARG